MSTLEDIENAAEAERLFELYSGDFKIDLSSSQSDPGAETLPLTFSDLVVDGFATELGSKITEDCVNMSLDLTEATYDMTHELLNNQVPALDQMFKDYLPWKVFRDAFVTFRREVDMTNIIQQGFWKGPEKIMTQTGSFMGDTMSFIHLSLFLRGATITVEPDGKRLLGQSVGDDLVLLAVQRDTAQRYLNVMTSLGARFSKINSISDDSITFCENYALIPNNLAELAGYAKDSVFGNLYFLDIIKGSLMTGKSKVNTTGSDPFFGHSRMMNLQNAYHPVKWVKERATAFLWDVNYHSARKLASAGASLPTELGGIDMAIGPSVMFDDKLFQEDFLPYYSAIADVNDDKVFFSFYSLLQGVYKAEPKGLPYENKLPRLEDIMAKLNWSRVSGADSLLPTYMLNKPWAQKHRFIANELNLTPIAWLVGEISRRSAFEDYWNGRKADTYMTLPIKEPVKRWREAWTEIRRSFGGAIANPRYTSIAMLKARFKERCWNVYFSKEDSAISEILGDCPSLRFDVTKSVDHFN